MSGDNKKTFNTVIKHFAMILAAIIFMAACKPYVPDHPAVYNVIPQPKEVMADPAGGEFHLTDATVIAVVNPGLMTEAQLLAEYIRTLTGRSLKIVEKEKNKNAIVLRADLESDNKEAYRIDVTSDLIEINGASPAGTFYGIQTLRKSIPAAGECNVLFPAVTISDEPRFAYRGAHFDVSRHFFPADSVKSFIDMMALHNINTLHWHLTDDQGWRVEIKSRPELIEVSSSRPGTIIGHTQDYDSVPVSGYYTQEQIRDIIDYAADRHITVIPEIDLPGHMVAALAAYPDLGCTGGPYEVWRKWGVSEDVLCAGNDSTYKFLDDVLGEIAEMFPAEYVHIGGDECPKVRWKECRKCQARIAALGLVSDSHSTKEEKLQSHVMKYASDFLAQKGKKVIVWDEALEGGLAPGAVVMSWRGEAGGIQAAKLGHDVIMSPNTYFYFDYYQTLDQKDEPIAIGGYIPLEKVYSYEPITENYTKEEAEHITGIQANLWTEYIKTFSQAQYMELPRMAALSEVQWSSHAKDYQAFMRRLPQLIGHYKANGYNYSTRVFDIEGQVDVNQDGRNVTVTLSTVDDAPIYYTTDGTEPSAESTLYSGPVSLDSSAVVRAVAVRPIGNSRERTDSVTFCLSTARGITLETNPSPKYSANGPQTLVDGVVGGDGYSSGGWMGFSGNDAVAVIDLGEPLQVSSVGTHTAVQTGGWVFDARGMKVELSDDGQKWRTVASENYPALGGPTNGVFTHTLAFEPQTARFVRTTVMSEKNIPAWHTAKGKTGFVFIDEIEVR